eukprot:5253677-Prymnesium_polylepis.2
MRSPRRLNGLRSAQPLLGDRDDDDGRAPAPSCSTSEHERAVSGRCGLIHRAAHTWRRAHRMAAKRTVECRVDRRLSCDADTRHDVSADGSCSCCSARRLQQLVRAVVLAPPGGLLQPWLILDGRTQGRTQKSERDRGRSLTTASRPEELAAWRGLVQLQVILGETGRNLGHHPVTDAFRALSRCRRV